MRNQFENILHNYNSLAKERIGISDTEEKQNHQDVVTKKVIETASLEHTRVSTQEKIFNIQVEKQRIFQKLKKRFHSIDIGKYFRGESSQNDVPVFFDQKLQELFYKDENGNQVLVTREEFLTDSEWGITYRPDVATFPVHLLKEFLLREAKAKLKTRLDEQIIADRSDSNDVHEFKKKAYQGVGENIKANNERSGVLAERMVENFLEQLSLAGIGDFTLIPADAEDDVERKVDFIIRRKNYNRGAQIKTAEVGLQFTINDNKEKQALKLKQIDKAKLQLRSGGYTEDLDDIVLVTMSGNEILGQYEEWKKTKAPGGPTKLWSREFKEKFFRQIMQGLMNPEEVELAISKL